MISILIAYESLQRLFAPVPIHFAEAIPIATLGLLVNIGSVWLLSGGDHDHSHGHGHSHGHSHAAHDDVRVIATSAGPLTLSIFEDGVPPVFRLTAPTMQAPVSIETIRPGGAREAFTLEPRGSYLESTHNIPEPHAFAAVLSIGAETHRLNSPSTIMGTARRTATTICAPP